MRSPTRASDSLKALLLSSVRSTGFWSVIAAVVGVVAVAAGGIMALTIDEIRNFSITLLMIGIALLALALVLSPRTLALFLIGRQGRYGANVVVMTVAFFAIAVLANFLIFRNPNRFDVTATRVFTLAPQTLQVLNELKSPVRANAFFVPDDPRYEFARNQAEALLTEFDRRATKFSHRFVDPELNKGVAQQYNVRQHPTVVFEVEGGTRQAVFSFTEQDFITAILVATGRERKRVYFLTGHQEASISRDVLTGNTNDEGLDFALEGAQRDNYTVRPFTFERMKAEDQRVPDDAALLVIAGPKQELRESEHRALAEYIKRGGRVLALFDPNTPASFADLLSKWGVKLGGHSVADAVSNVAGQMLTPLIQRANGQYIAGAGVGIADRLEITFFPQVTSVELALPPQEMPPHIRFLPLAFTTPASWLEADAENVNFVPGEDRRGPFPVAAVVEASGTLDGAERHPTAKLVVFGDSDFAKNKFFFSRDNSDFFLNSVNWLAEDYELISIRPKLIPFRELVVNTKEKDFIKWSSWFLPPSVMILLGALVWWRRR